MAKDCPICQVLPETQTETTAAEQRASGQGLMTNITCPRCAEFSWPHPFLANRLPEETALRLSAAARRAREAGSPLVFGSQEVIDEVANSSIPPLSYTAYVDAVMDRLASIARYPGRIAEVGHIGRLASVAFMHFDDVLNLLWQLKTEGLMEVKDADKLRLKVNLSARGWERADAVRRQGAGLTRAFVAMAFADEMKPAYDDGIRPALIACGYKPPFRVDDPEHEETWKISAEEAKKGQKIDDRILAEIRRSRFVVVDITHHRNAVYFEGGFAEGLGLPIIWTCREDAMATASFDTRQIEHLLWKEPADLRAKLIARVERRGWRL